MKTQEFTAVLDRPVESDADHDRIRVGRSYESVRKLRGGERGPGGFPQPQSVGAYTVYSWSQVATWFRTRLQVELAAADTTDQVLAAADHLLRAPTLIDAATLARLAPLTAA